MKKKGKKIMNTSEVLKIVNTLLTQTALHGKISKRF